MSTQENKVAAQDAACDQPASTPNKFEGKVVNMTGNKLVIRNKNGQEYVHTLANDAILTCDGNACQSSDLKPGRQIRVTTRENDRTVATCVEALDKEPKFAQCN